MAHTPDGSSTLTAAQTAREEGSGSYQLDAPGRLLVIAIRMREGMRCATSERFSPAVGITCQRA